MAANLKIFAIFEYLIIFVPNKESYEKNIMKNIVKINRSLSITYFNRPLAGQNYHSRRL
jgi:hypothetical protein